MRATIKVTDLTLRQWDALQDSLLTEYDMPPGAVRVCVTFESDAATVEERHIEMPVRVFINLIHGLALVEPVMIDPPDYDETPSVFPGAPPIRTYADGSQTYGPYARPVEDVGLPYGFDQDGNVVALDQDGSP